MILRRAQVSANGGQVFASDIGAGARASRLWYRAEVAGNFIVTCAPSEGATEMAVQLAAGSAAAGTVYTLTIDGPAGFVAVKFTPSATEQAQTTVAMEVSP